MEAVRQLCHKVVEAGAQINWALRADPFQCREHRHELTLLTAVPGRSTGSRHLSGAEETAKRVRTAVEPLEQALHRPAPAAEPRLGVLLASPPVRSQLLSQLQGCLLRLALRRCKAQPLSGPLDLPPLGTPTQLTSRHAGPSRLARRRHQRGGEERTQPPLLERLADLGRRWPQPAPPIRHMAWRVEREGTGMDSAANDQQREPRPGATAAPAMTPNPAAPAIATTWSPSR